MARSIDFSENPSKNRIFAKLAMFTVKYLKTSAPQKYFIDAER